jgi:hypothetical protein
MENLLGLVRIKSECPSKKCADSAQTPHGLQAAVTVVSVPSWQLASSRGVRVESAESARTSAEYVGESKDLQAVYPFKAPGIH